MFEASSIVRHRSDFLIDEVVAPQYAVNHICVHLHKRTIMQCALYMTVSRICYSTDHISTLMNVCQLHPDFFAHVIALVGCHVCMHRLGIYTALCNLSTCIHTSVLFSNSPADQWRRYRAHLALINCRACPAVVFLMNMCIMAFLK